MAKVYSDIPDDILEMIQKIDTSNVKSEEIPSLMKKLHELTAQHVKIRTYGGDTMEMDIPQEAADFLNRYDFKNVSALKKAISKPFIVKYLKANKLLKN